MGQPYQTDPLHNLKIILRFLLLFYRVFRYKKKRCPVIFVSSLHARKERKA